MTSFVIVVLNSNKVCQLLSTWWFWLIDRLDKAEVGVRGLRVRETEAEIKEMRILRQEREAQCNEKVRHLLACLPTMLLNQLLRITNLVL